MNFFFHLNFSIFSRKKKTKHYYVEEEKMYKRVSIVFVFRIANNNEKTLGRFRCVYIYISELLCLIIISCNTNTLTFDGKEIMAAI